MSRNYLERINRLNQAVEAEEVSFEIYSRKIQSVLKKEARKQKAGYLPKQNDPQRLNLFKDEINWAMRDNAFWPIISVEMKDGYLVYSCGDHTHKAIITKDWSLHRAFKRIEKWLKNELPTRYLTDYLSRQATKRLEECIKKFPTPHVGGYVSGKYFCRITINSGGPQPLYLRFYYKPSNDTVDRLEFENLSLQCFTKVSESTNTLFKPLNGIVDMFRDKVFPLSELDDLLTSFLDKIKKDLT